MSENIKITNGIEPTVGFPKHMRLIKSNSAFCSMLINKSPMTTIVDDESRSDINGRSLIYNISKRDNYAQEALQSIIDLLMQLRAAQDEQNGFFQNNTVVRQQVLQQLKNEILNVKNNLTQGQVQKLQLVSNNLFDEKTLNELLKSLLEESKKKSEAEEGLKGKYSTRTVRENLKIFSNISRSYTNLVNLTNKYTNITRAVSQKEILEKSFPEKRLINIKRPLTIHETEGYQEAKPEPEKHTELQKSVNRVLEQRGFSQATEVLKSIFREKQIINRYTDLFKVKLTALELQRKVESRNLGYFIHEDTKKRREKLSKISENRVLFERSRAEFKFLKVHNVKETEEKQETQEVKREQLKLIDKEVKSHLNKKLSLTTEIAENISKNILVKKDIFSIYNKVISENIREKALKRAFSKTSLITHRTQKANISTQKYSQKENINSLASYIFSTSKIKNQLINVTSSERFKVKSKEIQNRALNKNILNTFNIQKTSERIIQDTDLIGRKTEKSIKIQEIENRLQQTNKTILKTELEKRVKSKKLNKYIIEPEIKNVQKIYNQAVINEYEKAAVKTAEIYKKSKAVNITTLLNKEILLNKRLQEKEELAKKITERSVIDERLIKQHRVSDKTELVIKKETALSQIDKDVNILNQKNLTQVLKKLYSNTINIQSKEKKNIFLETEKLYRDRIKRLKTSQIINKNILNVFKDEKLTRLDIEKSRTIFTQKAPVINQSDIDLLIKTTSQEIINKALTTKQIKHVKKSLIDEKVLSSVKNKSEQLFKSPLISRERIRNVKVIKNDIYEKFSSVLSPKIRELSKTLVQEKTLYREIEEAQRSYFNNLGENIEERILLNRQKVSSLENVYREIQRDEVVYKKPIDIKKITEKEEEQAKESEPSKSRRQPHKQQNAEQRHYEPPPRKEVVTQREKGLTRDDVMRMIQAYMGDLDVDEMSDRIIERVEEEMLSQRRRSGII